MSGTGAFATKADLVTAVQAWDADSAAAGLTYGPISSWNVSLVTNMNELFKNLASFNADVSSWNTAGVTDMGSMFYVRIARALPNF